MKNELLNRFYDAIKKAESINSSLKVKRFYPMITQSKKGGNPTEIGLYDGLHKKYTLIDTRSHELENCVKEVEHMVKRAS